MIIKRIPFLAAVAAGYVLGTRAGRARYEQIKTQADKVWHDPRVQQATADAQDYVAEKAPVVKEKATDLANQAAESAKKAAGAATDKVSDLKGSADDDLEGIDLVAAASTVPEDDDSADPHPTPGAL